MTASKTALRNLVSAALLCAAGIVIPTFSPIKIVLEPASFTLASHVAIFLAMFLSPSVAVAVSLGTTLGFFLGGFPLPIVLRALTHVAFAFCGALALQKRPELLASPRTALPFSFLIGLIHAVCEVAVITPLYFGHSMSADFYAKGYFTAVLLLVGAGSVVHSMVDFAIAQAAGPPPKKTLGLSKNETPPAERDGALLPISTCRSL